MSRRLDPMYAAILGAFAGIVIKCVEILVRSDFAMRGKLAEIWAFAFGGAIVLALVAVIWNRFLRRPNSN
jgi:hypothetical protein